MSEFDLLSVAADGMSVERSLLDVAARNVAAAQASTPQHPYPRLVARFASTEPDAGDALFDIPGDDEEHRTTRGPAWSAPCPAAMAPMRSPR